MTKKFLSIFIDPATGKEYALDQYTQSGLFFIESTSATPMQLWNIPHNKTTNKVLIFISDINGETVDTAEEISFSDDLNSVIIRFSVPFAGTVNLIIFDATTAIAPTLTPNVTPSPTPTITNSVSISLTPTATLTVTPTITST